MKTYRKDELEAGKVYKCVLSGRKVLVTYVKKRSEFISELNKNIEDIDVSTVSFNPVSGVVDTFYPIYDHILTDLIESETSNQEV